jgi:putative oxidoreductase
MGLLTRIAAIGMAGFVMVQSYVGITGHNKTGANLGAWFDGTSNKLVMDQRLMRMLLFAIMILKGAGPFSLDWVIRHFMRP